MRPSDRLISSVRHPLVRRVRALLQDAGRRDQERCFLVEGPRIVREALDCALTVERALISPEGAGQPWLGELLGQLERARIPCHRLAPHALAAVQDADAPQGIALIVRIPRHDLDSALARRAGASRLAVVAWQIQDPGNLGAIVRAAEGSGADAVVVVRGGADPFHPRAVRGSAGSVLRVPVVRGADPAGLPEELAARGFALVGTAPDGGEDFRRVDLTGDLALVLGNEGAGLPPEIEQRLARRVTIPMRGRVESLNVAVSAALLLFEAARQREA